MLLQYVLAHHRYLNVLGIGVILCIAYFFSKNRSAVEFKKIALGLIVQLSLGIFALRVPVGTAILHGISQYVVHMYHYADEGSRFLFGNLVDAQSAWGFIFAFKVLPIIVFFGAFMSIMFYLGIAQRIVEGMNYLIRPFLGTSGPETLCAVANSFLGQTEAPLLIRHYLTHMTKSEIFVVMVSGMATISGAILVVYVAMGIPVEHLLASSVMSIPASIVIAKIIVPQTDRLSSTSNSEVQVAQAGNVFDAIARGTTDGLQLALAIGAMLISFIALLALLNGMLHYGTSIVNYLFSVAHVSVTVPVLTVEAILGYILLPFGYLLGFTGKQAFQASELLGIKVAVNEVIAYSTLVKLNFSERAKAIMTYALCGFSNFSCIGIQIGGIGSLVPKKRQWFTELGLYAVLGGTLANLLSAMIAGLLL